MAAHLMFVRHQAGRGLGEAAGDAHFLNPFIQDFFDAFGEIFQLAIIRSLFGFILALLIGQVAQVQFALVHRGQRFLLVFGQVGNQPFIDRVGEQQHFDAFFTEYLEVGAVFRGGIIFRSHVINGLLAFLHPGDVIIQGNGFFLRVLMGGLEAEQFGEVLAFVRRVDNSFLHDPAERLPELTVLVRFLVRQFLQQVQYPLRTGRADGFDDLVLLQDLPGDIQRQVVGIHHAFYETQVRGQQLFCVVHDEYPLDVEFDAVALFPVPQIKRCARGNEQQAGVFQFAFHPGMDATERVLKIMGHGLVELVVLLVLYVLFVARP